MITTHMRKETKKRGIQWSSAFRYILLCSIVTASVSCSDRKDEKKSIGAKELTTFNGTAMTINYHVDVGQKLTGEEKSRCEKIIKSSFSEIDEIYNKWNPQSELSQINQARSGKKIKVSKKLINFLQKCDHFVTLSNGRFDPTIEPIQALWKKQLEQNREPTEQEIEKLRPAIGWDKLIIEPDGVTKKHPLTQLDLSAIAKGYAIDLITERLNAIGLHDLFIDWGGEIRATGNHPQGRHWTVYIANLNDTNPENALAYTPLIDQSIATSGDYLQQWTVIHTDGTTTNIAASCGPFGAVG